MAEQRALRSEDLLWRVLGDEAVLLDLRSRQYLSSNASATKLLELLSAGAHFEDLVRALVDAYGIDESVASGDVTKFLALLDERGLLAGE